MAQPVRLVFIALITLTGIALSSCGGGSSGITPNESTTAPQPGSAGAPPATSPLLYVANSGANISSASVTVYSLNANGNASPVNVIAGLQTSLNSPQDVAFDARGNMYVSNLATPTCGCGLAHVTVFGPGATGDVAPIAVICGPDTGLSNPIGIALDAVGNLYVANEGNNTVTVYAPGASGDAAPTATIGGTATDISFPEGIGLDAAGQIYVANGGGSGNVNVFPAGATGNVAPVRSIPPPFAPPTFTFNTALTFDGSGNLYVIGTATNIRGFVDIYAPGTSVPRAQILGPNTGFDVPDGIAVDAAGNTYVADNVCCPSHIHVFAAGANGDASPVRTITGDATLLTFPMGMAIH